jgi:hypothetical protein
LNRYDDRARLVFHFAREEGSKLGHAMIGPEHLLLGLMREGGTASRVLGEFGATLEGFRRQVEEMVGRGDGLPRNETAAITPRARRVMELAGSEARSLGSTVIATEHILLGIIREGDGVAYRILQQLTRDVDTVRWPPPTPRRRPRRSTPLFWTSTPAISPNRLETASSIRSSAASRRSAASSRSSRAAPRTIRF